MPILFKLLVLIVRGLANIMITVLRRLKGFLMSERHFV